MKKVFATVLAAMMSVSAFAINIFNYTEISESVRSYTRTDYVLSTKFGKTYRTPNMKIIYNLDKNGNIIEIAEFTAKDALLNRTIYDYDKSGNLLEERCFDANGNLMWKTVITYEGGKKVDSSEYGKNEILRGKVIYGYTGENLTEETCYDEDGALVWKSIYKYENGEISVVSQYSFNGSLDQEETYKYNEDGYIELISMTDRARKGAIQQKFRYASDGSLSEITTYNENKEITNRLLVKYDNDGNVSSLKEYAVTEKFGSTQNELISLCDYTYSKDVVNTEEIGKPVYVDAK